MSRLYTVWQSCTLDLTSLSNLFWLTYLGNWVTTISDSSPWNSPILPIVEHKRVHQLRTVVMKNIGLFVYLSALKIGPFFTRLCTEVKPNAKFAAISRLHLSISPVTWSRSTTCPRRPQKNNAHPQIPMKCTQNISSRNKWFLDWIAVQNVSTNITFIVNN